MKKRIRRVDSERQRYWEEVLGRFGQGGQTVRAFCRAEGLRESAFYFWRQELARRARRAAAKSPRATASEVSPRRDAGPAFLPVQVVEPGVPEADRGVEIVLARGCTVRVPLGFDRQTLADVLSVLEVRPC